MQLDLNRELIRKALHFFLLLVPVLYLKLGKWTFLSIFVPISLIVIALDYYRARSPIIQKTFLFIFKPVLRSHEIGAGRLCGASFVAMAICINFLLFKQQIAVTAFMILVVSDALSAIVGKSVVSPPFFEKTIAGSVAFFMSALLIVIISGLYFSAGFLFYLFGIFAAFCTTVIESRPGLLGGVDDNLTVPVSFALMMTFFDLLWNYLV